MMANLVWAMPQFSLGTAALQQNLFPDVGWLADRQGEWICAGILFAIAAVVIAFYESGGRGVKVFEGILKAMVGLVVVSFFGVVAAMSWKGQLDWGAIASGFVPDISLLWRPVASLQAFVDASGDSAYWTDTILSTQRERMIAAAATAVGINMTFLLPYSMLRKGWDKTFRGLACFDLSTGLFIPFLLATSCVVIAAASQFHARFNESQLALPAAQIDGQYRGNLEARLKAELGAEAFAALDTAAVNERIDALPKADKQLSLMLVKRDAFDLARALENLFGKGGLTQKIFGVGVLGMAISTIIILMVINGFCINEMFGWSGGSRSRLGGLVGALLPGVTGSLGFLWLWSNSDAKFWLAVPTSNFGMALLPIAYITFFLMMNSRALLGDAPANRRLAAAGQHVDAGGDCGGECRRRHEHLGQHWLDRRRTGGRPAGARSGCAGPPQTGLMFTAVFTATISETPFPIQRFSLVAMAGTIGRVGCGVGDSSRLKAGPAAMPQGQFSDESQLCRPSSKRREDREICKGDIDHQHQGNQYSASQPRVPPRLHVDGSDIFLFKLSRPRADFTDN